MIFRLVAAKARSNGAIELFVLQFLQFMITMSKKYNLLRSHNNSLTLVDCTQKDDRIEAGFVCCEPVARITEIVHSESGDSIAIQVPEVITSIANGCAFYFKNEPVEFLLSSIALK